MTRTVLAPATESRLVELYPTHSGTEIAALLGIGLKTVYKTAVRLGLKKSREWIADRARLRTLNLENKGRVRRVPPTQTNARHLSPCCLIDAM